MVTESMEKAFAWCRLAAHQGYDLAQCRLARCFLHVSCMAKKGRKIWKKVRDGIGLQRIGNVILHNMVLLFSSKKVEDSHEAVKWMLLAAEGGELRAQCTLAFFYSCGIGGKIDRQQAVRWYRLAAEQGFAEAQHSLGMCYHVDDDDEEEYELDFVEAVKWYQLAADQGYVYAQRRLGLCYWFGLGVTKDVCEGARWYRLAADQGDGEAQYNLGMCYHDGVGVAQDMSEAARWLQLAADQHYIYAQLELKRDEYNMESK